MGLQKYSKENERYATRGEGLNKLIDCDKNLCISIRISRNNNITTLYGMDNNDMYHVPGFPDIDAVIEFVRPDNQLVSDIQGMSNLDFRVPYGDDWWYLENCMVSSFDTSIGPNVSRMTVDLKVGDMKPAELDVEFKDGIRKVKYQHYRLVKKPESYTYNEFMDKVMVEEL